MKNAVHHQETALENLLPFHSIVGRPIVPLLQTERHLEVVLVRRDDDEPVVIAGDTRAGNSPFQQGRVVRFERQVTAETELPVVEP